eukprot:5554693-Amphidinium_carterae.1
MPLQGSVFVLVPGMPEAEHLATAFCEPLWTLVLLTHCSTPRKAKMRIPIDFPMFGVDLLCIEVSECRSFFAPATTASKEPSVVPPTQAHSEVAEYCGTPSLSDDKVLRLIRCCSQGLLMGTASGLPSLH